MPDDLAPESPDAAPLAPDVRSVDEPTPVAPHPLAPEPVAAGRIPSARTGPPSVLARNLVIGPLIVLVIAGYVGDTVFLAYHDEHPLCCIAMNARNRNLRAGQPVPRRRLATTSSARCGC